MEVIVELEVKSLNKVQLQGRKVPLDILLITEILLNPLSLNLLTTTTPIKKALVLATSVISIPNFRVSSVFKLQDLSGRGGGGSSSPPLPFGCPNASP